MLRKSDSIYASSSLKPQSMGTVTVTVTSNPNRNCHLSSSLFPSKPYHFFLTKRQTSSRISRVRVRAYLERNPNSLGSIASKVIGSLPVVGLIARILNAEGGLGGDVIDFAEFRRRVGNKCAVSDSRAFYEFQDRRGKAGNPLYVLLCCWLAAVGAGYLKSEEILEAVARLRISNDTEFEEETCLSIMTAAKEKRAKLKAAVPEIPMEVRVEKALEAIYVCCFGRDLVEEEDVRLLCIILRAVFPSVGKSEIERMVSVMAKQVADGERRNYPEPRTLSKEAVQRQMKDLQFLKQNSDYST